MSIDLIDLGLNDLPAFCPVFQGIFLLTAQGSQVVYGWEALLRGPVGTSQENPINLFGRARERGRLVEIDLLAFCLSCRCFAANDPGGKLFVNLFPETLACRDFTVSALFRFLKKVNLPPERLVIEIVESVFDLSRLVRPVEDLSSIGIQFALDDFGSGHRDLDRWIRLRPDYVKCDRSLIQGVGGNARKARAIQMLEGLCSADGTILLAEGVETKSEFDFLLAETKIRLFQGFYFGFPSPLVSKRLSLKKGARHIQGCRIAGSF